ncbi:hypothetical protein [Sphingomonas sp. Leaf4]|uniref:hypothetical protein n=1 Tax=Sphingomonas sp. Leaf4 TaxID=2876553 RepID=UPI001E4054F1|nr:hypothetical protein [Sphingomonas sp. Leaf4]
MHAGLRSALFGSALPLAGFELGMDFRAGWYRSGAVVTRDPLALPGASFGRDRAKWDNIGGALIATPAGQPAIIPGIGYAAREPVQNLAPNSSWAGAAVGNSTIPTLNMALGTRGGLTLAVVAVGIENGLGYIDLRFSGTANNTGNPGQPVLFYPVFSGSGGTSHPAAAQGDSFITAITSRVVAGSVSNIVARSLSTSFRDDAGTNILLNNTQVQFLGADPSVNNRAITPPIVSTFATSRYWAHLTLGVNDGQTVDATFRILGASINKSAIEQPHIATGGGSVSMSGDNMRLTQPMPTNEDWVFVSAVTALRTSAQHSGNGNKRYWRILDGTIERIGIYRNIPIQNGAQGRINAIVTGADGDVKRPAGGDIPQAGRMVSVVRKVGTGYSIATRAPDGTIQIGGAQTLAQFPSPLVDIHLAPELEGYHEFLGWRRGTFSDDQVRGMLAALA